MKKNRQPQVTGAEENLSLLALAGKDTAVAGLIWQPIHTVRNIQVEVKGLIKNEKCQYYLTHIQGNRAQCGMTNSLPQNRRCWSAILLLRETLGDSWLGLFRLPDGRFWLAAIDNGIVVPGGDAIFDDEALATERYRDYSELFPWEIKYVSGIEGLAGENIDLLARLKGATMKSSYRILFSQQIRRRARLLLTRGLAIALTLGITAGGWGYYQHQLEQERIERERAEQLARLKVSGFAERAWRGVKPARQMITACVNEMYQYPVDIAGWALVDLRCDGEKVLAHYKAGIHATSKNFAQSLQDKKFRFQQGMFAEVISLIKVSGDRKMEQLQPIKSIASDVLEILQSGIAKGKMDDVLSSGMRMAKYELTTELSPLTVMQLKNMDGVVVRSIHSKLSTTNKISWTLTGEVYGK